MAESATRTSGPDSEKFRSGPRTCRAPEAILAVMMVVQYDRRPAKKEPSQTLFCAIQGRRSMRRREFVAGLGGAAAWPLAARAQQQPMPVIGFLHTASAEAFQSQLDAFHQGLKNAG